MTKKRFIILLIVVVASSVVGFFYYAQHGEFTKWSHTSLNRQLLEGGETYYIDYLIRWEGVGTPILEKIEFIKKDGTKVTNDDKQFLIEAFASKEQYGSVNEETAIQKGIINQLSPINGYKVNDDFTLVMKVKLKSNEITNDISSLKVTYNKLGVNAVQNISFDDGIVADE